jgi:subtilisin family serine protease
VRRWISVAAAALLAVPVGVEVAHADPIGTAKTTAASKANAAAAPAAEPAILPAGHVYTVTLLTGDVVTVRTTQQRCPNISVRPAHAGDVLARSCGPDGHVHVVPASLGALSKRIDPALFDVTTLIQEGYDDAHTADLPLIVRYAAGHGRSTFSAQMPGQRNLPSMRGIAVKEPKHSAATLVRPLLATTTSRDIDHIWLDRRVEASALATVTGADAPTTVTGPPTVVRETPAAADGLAPDLTQIGAPTAWQAGDTGKGARVAVLDTGVDASHPDLASKIVASKNFTDDTNDTTDRFGHGTHVAATIAGSGAASGGRYRGVAPDAELLIGKVLGDDGFGTESQVIAGMQWAAPMAKVVNMSLGGDFTDGTDPESLALDSLSAQYGTLFVVAAGNDGPFGVSVESPGSAAAALTVGAVDATDTVADFSSRGPQNGVALMKPEIVAPGVDIVSARAAGTDLGTPIDSFYTELSGTSMATPHVAGAAAILAEVHPQWNATQLKDALTAGADPAHGDAYAQGAGRVDIPHALADPVLPDTSVVDLGTLHYPQRGTVSSTLSWTDSVAAPETLHLALTAATHADVAVPTGTVRLSASSVTVAAGATAGVRVTVNDGALADKPGYYDGMITATVDEQTVRTPIAFFIEPHSFDLTLRQTLLPGSAPGSAFNFDTIVNLDDPDLFNESVGGDLSTPLTMRVPEGRYSVTGVVLDTTVDGLDRDALVGTPEVRIDEPTTVTFDAARAKPVTAAIAGVDTEVDNAAVNLVQAGQDGIPWWTAAAATGPETDGPQVFATPMPDVDVGFLHPSEAFGLRAPGTAPSPVEYSIGRFLPHGLPADPAYRLDKVGLAAMARIDETVNRLDIPDTTAGFQRYLVSPDGFLVGENFEAEVPTQQTDYVTPGLMWIDEAFVNGPPDEPLTQGETLNFEPAASYAPRSRTSKVWLNQPLHPDWNDAPQGPGCQPLPMSRTSGNLHVALASMVDAHNRSNCLSFAPWFGGDRTLTLFRNGRQIASKSLGTFDDAAADFTIPSAASTYRLVYDEDAAGPSDAFPISTQSTTAWTFRSSGPPGTTSAPLALLSVNYSLPLNSANRLTGDTATFAVLQSHGVPTQQITQLTVWTSENNGRTWTRAAGGPIGGGRFTVRLPAATAGQSVSLRVDAVGSGGSEIDQTIMNAYRVAG